MHGVPCWSWPQIHIRRGFPRRRPGDLRVALRPCAPSRTRKVCQLCDFCLEGVDANWCSCYGLVYGRLPLFPNQPIWMAFRRLRSRSMGPRARRHPADRVDVATWSPRRREQARQQTTARGRRSSHRVSRLTRWSSTDHGPCRGVLRIPRCHVLSFIIMVLHD
jgi:hypothetical protein